MKYPPTLFRKMNSHQHGLALPMSLILLFVMTLLGVASLRMTTMDEQMTGNNRLREIAFNAAETTLIYAEQQIVEKKINLRKKVFTNGSLPQDDVTSDPEPGNTCNDGYCIPRQYHVSNTTYNGDERWLDSTLNVWETTTKHLTYGGYDTSGLESEGIFSAPKYIIEFLGHTYEQVIGAPYGTGSDCFDDTSQTILPESARSWPFCPTDPQVARITVLSLAGDPAKNARVMLQSTIVFQN